MLREKEELMLRLQDYEEKTKKAEKGEAALPRDGVWSPLFPQRGRQGLDSGGEQALGTHVVLDMSPGDRDVEQRSNDMVLRLENN